MEKLAKISLLIAIFFSFNLLVKAKNETIVYTWQVAGHTLRVKAEFSDILYNEYLNTPRSKAGKDADSYYRQFMKRLPGDNVLAKLAADFKSLAVKEKLSEVLIATSFVQALPYNFDEVGAGKHAAIDFPYVTLARGSGTCWDKAILGAALLKAMGYSTAVIYFDAVPLPQGGTDKHVAFAVVGAPAYNIFAGYSYVETHNIVPLGYVPQVQGAGSLEYDARDKNPKHNRQNAAKLGPYQILLKIPGNKLSAENLAGF
jgi:hypothetical protein